MSLFVKLETRSLTNGKLLAAGPEACWVWTRGLMYSKEHLTDGFIPKGALPLLTLGCLDPQAVCERLIEAELWERCEGGFTVGEERWAEHQTTAEEVEQSRENGRQRQRAHRERIRQQREEEERLRREREDSTRNGNVTPMSHVTPEAENREQSQSTEPEYREEKQGAPSELPDRPYTSIAHEIVCAHPKARAKHYTALDVTHAQLTAVLEAVQAECKGANCLPQIAEEMLLTLTRDIASAVEEWPPGEQPRVVKDVVPFFRERDYRKPIEQWRYAGDKRNRSQERTVRNIDAARRASGF